MIQIATFWASFHACFLGCFQATELVGLIQSCSYVNLSIFHLSQDINKSTLDVIAWPQVAVNSGQCPTTKRNKSQYNQSISTSQAKNGNVDR